MPLWFMRLFWGLLGGAALIVGASVGYFAREQQRMVAGVMAFGSGGLISALAFDLMDDAFHRGGFLPVSLGFVSGAAAYTSANVVLARHGANHRKRSGGKQPSERALPGSGLVMVIGAPLDGTSESMAVGVCMIAGGAVGVVPVA